MTPMLGPTSASSMSRPEWQPIEKRSLPANELMRVTDVGGREQVGVHAAGVVNCGQSTGEVEVGVEAVDPVVPCRAARALSSWLSVQVSLMRLCGESPFVARLAETALCSRGREGVAGGEAGGGVQVAARVDEAGKRRFDFGCGLDQAPDGQLRRVQSRAADAQRLGEA